MRAIWSREVRDRVEEVEGVVVLDGGVARLGGVEEVVVWGALKALAGAAGEAVVGRLGGIVVVGWCCRGGFHGFEGHVSCP